MKKFLSMVLVLVMIATCACLATDATTVQCTKLFVRRMTVSLSFTQAVILTCLLL